LLYAASAFAVNKVIEKKFCKFPLRGGGGSGENTDMLGLDLTFLKLGHHLSSSSRALSSASSWRSFATIGGIMQGTLLALMRCRT
jgi:hypothetical protein